MYERYRARTQFQWNGFIYGPEGPCKCTCSARRCTSSHGTGCKYCQNHNCKCGCTVNEFQFAGSIWIVEAGHPRKDAMLRSRKVFGDATLPSVDELLEDEKHSRLVKTVAEILETELKKPEKVTLGV